MKRVIKTQIKRKNVKKSLFSKEEILRIPNLLTLFRLMILPFFIYYLNKSLLVSALLFLAMMLLDKVDGVVARFFGKETRFGRFFDGLADAIIMFFSLVFLWWYSYLSVFQAFSIIFVGFVGAVIVSLRIMKRVAFFTESRTYQKVAGVSIYLLIFISLFKINPIAINVIFYASMLLNIYKIYLDSRKAVEEYSK
ncbi:MAG TPA: CDP-alcohol phosphatidyltransferase family protein [Candidatus Nanoarchaeia archaeon]|nr:CDP-alcohol phosphatidyltransferase family protein [Candidatus Nanoarchaeia archaeon]